MQVWWIPMQIFPSEYGDIILILLYKCFPNFLYQVTYTGASPMLPKVFHENVIRSRLELFWKTNRSENFNDNNNDDDDDHNNNNNNLRLIQAARGDKIDGLEAVSVLKRSKKEKILEDW